MSEITCPKCGHEAGHVVYGSVPSARPGEESWFDRHARGDIYLGGCCVYKTSPKYACKSLDCRHLFGLYLDD